MAKKGLYMRDLDDAFFAKIATKGNMIFHSWKQVPLDSSAGVVSSILDLNSSTDSPMRGIYGFELCGFSASDVRDIQDGSLSVQDGDQSNPDGAQSIQDGVQNVQDGSNSIKDGDKSIQDGAQSVQDESSLIKDEEQSIQDGVQNVQDESNSIKDGDQSIQDGAQSVNDGSSFIKDGNQSIQAGGPNISKEKMTVLIALKVKGKGVLDSVVECVQHKGKDFVDGFRKYLPILYDGSLSGETRLMERSMTDARLERIMPKVYYTEEDPTRDVCLFAMEFFDPNKFTHISKIGAEFWTKELRFKVLRDLAIFHASFVGRTDELLDYEPMAEVLKCAVNRKSRAKAYLLEALAEAETSFPELVTSKRKRMMENYVTHVDDVTKELKQQPMTLVHYDAHAGNLCFRRNPLEGEMETCLFDWECAAIHVPQLDMAQFLIYTLPVSTDLEDHRSLWRDHMDFYQQELYRQLRGRTDIQQFFKKNNFQKIADYMAFECMLNPLAVDLFLPEELGLNNIHEALENGFMYMKAVEMQYPILQGGLPR